MLNEERIKLVPCISNRKYQKRLKSLDVTNLETRDL